MSRRCRCGALWAHPNACHCPTCHRSFASVTAFDAHRPHGACIDPAAAGLRLVWQRGRGGEGRTGAANGAAVWSLKPHPAHRSPIST